MQMIIWAFSSMFVLLLIISFLPLGFTGKGKLFIVLASFLLALGGLIAISSFPLWQTALMLAALIFFSAYFMDRSIGKLIFKENPRFEQELTEGYDTPVSDFKMDIVKDNNSTEITELEIVEPPVTKQVIGNENNKLDEDISFLLERNSASETVDQMERESVLEIGYLSDIESLLDGDITDLSSTNEEETSKKQIVPNDNEPIVDSTFDFLNLQKEVAVGLDEDIHVEVKQRKKINLQK